MYVCIEKIKPVRTNQLIVNVLQMSQGTCSQETKPTMAPQLEQEATTTSSGSSLVDVIAQDTCIRGPGGSFLTSLISSMTLHVLQTISMMCPTPGELASMQEKMLYMNMELPRGRGCSAIIRVLQKCRKDEGFVTMRLHSASYSALPATTPISRSEAAQYTWTRLVTMKSIASELFMNLKRHLQESGFGSNFYDDERTVAILADDPIVVDILKYLELKDKYVYVKNPVHFWFVMQHSDDYDCFSKHLCNYLNNNGCLAMFSEWKMCTAQKDFHKALINIGSC